MKAMLIQQLVTVLLSMLTPDMLKKAVDSLLDIAEDAVAKSETTIDDKVVLPLIQTVRVAFDIPDND